MSCDYCGCDCCDDEDDYVPPTPEEIAAAQAAHEAKLAAMTPEARHLYDTSQALLRRIERAMLYPDESVGLSGLQTLIDPASSD